MQQVGVGGTGEVGLDPLDRPLDPGAVTVAEVLHAKASWSDLHGGVLQE